MKSNRLISLLLAGAASISVAGCMGESQGYVVASYDAPPPPREEAVVYRPGYVWIHGNWRRGGDRWVWNNGYYARERTGYVYEDGHWARNGRNYVWVQGQWRPRGHVVIRERRRY
jgi:hypothetical protein